jgi:hypothetical protein
MTCQERLSIRLQEVIQSVGTMLNKAEVTSSNPHLPSCADMSGKKKNQAFIKNLNHNKSNKNKNKYCYPKKKKKSNKKYVFDINKNDNKSKTT